MFIFICMYFCLFSNKDLMLLKYGNMLLKYGILIKIRFIRNLILLFYKFYGVWNQLANSLPLLETVKIQLNDPCIYNEHTGTTLQNKWQYIYIYIYISNRLKNEIQSWVLRCCDCPTYFHHFFRTILSASEAFAHALRSMYRSIYCQCMEIIYMDMNSM